MGPNEKDPDSPTYFKFSSTFSLTNQELHELHADSSVNIELFCIDVASAQILVPPSTTVCVEGSLFYRTDQHTIVKSPLNITTG